MGSAPIPVVNLCIQCASYTHIEMWFFLLSLYPKIFLLFSSFAILILHLVFLSSILMEFFTCLTSNFGTLLTHTCFIFLDDDDLQSDFEWYEVVIKTHVGFTLIRNIHEFNWRKSGPLE
jgi:hypothetical protein